MIKVGENEMKSILPADLDTLVTPVHNGGGRFVSAGTACDQCPIVVHLVAQPKRAAGQVGPPVKVDAITFAASLWAAGFDALARFQEL